MKEVTDEDVERYLNHVRRPASAWKSNSRRSGISPALEAASPFVRRAPEVRPPEPVRHLMKDGVWLVPGAGPPPDPTPDVPPPPPPPPPPEPSPEPKRPEPPPEKPRPRRAPSGRSLNDRDPETGLTFRALLQRELKEQGLCVSCRKVRDGASQVYCEACVTMRHAWTAERKLRRSGG